MKKVKITKEQYTKLVKAGIIKEGMSNVDKSFKSAFAGKDIHSLKYVPEEQIKLGPKFKLNQPLSSIHEEVKNLLEYIYGLNEEFSTFWESHNLTYEDLCETLESKGYLIRKEGAYKVSKKMGDAKAVKEGIAQTLSEMLRPIEEDYPAGAQFDPNAPWNREEPKSVRGEKAAKKFVDLKYYNPEIAIFRDENSGEFYVFYYGDLDTKVFEPYAERQGFIDPDGDMEYYDEFDIDDDTLENYVNDNFPKLTKGVGADDFVSGKTDLVLVDEELKSELLHLYDKDSRLVMVLEPIAEGTEITPNKDDAGEYLKYLTARDKREKEKIQNQLELDLDEVTGAASSGAYTGLFSGSEEKPEEYDGKKLPPVVAEMDLAGAGTIGYDNPGFVGISRDGKFPTNPKKTKAQKNTQWAGGAFVEMDDCTKLNNNKEAQKGKCSTSAADNVVKLKKTKSNINAPSLAESIETEVSKLLMVENAAEWEKAGKENIANTFASMPKLKDLKEYGLKYSVKAVKNLLVDKYEDGNFVNNKWKREHMVFPQELDILNVIIQSRLAKFYFKTAIEQRAGITFWNWEKHIKKEDIDNFPIPPSVFQIVKDELTATENNPFKAQNNPPKLEEGKKYTIYKLDRLVKKNNI